jgi:hypothetical protein
MSDLSSATKTLLHAAKADAPSAVTRAKIWKGVAAATVGAGGAATGAVGTGSAVASSGAGKLLAFGGLLGSTVTVGLALTLLRIAPATPPAAVAAPATVAMMQAAPLEMANAPPKVDSLGPGVGLDPSPLGGNEPSAAPPQAQPKAAPLAPAPRTKHVSALPAAPKPAATTLATATASPAAAEEDALLREASLVAEARGALVRGDAAGALRAIRATHQLPVRQLVPEEMSLEAQALRALGRKDDATKVDGALKTKFPDSALAR